jgi:hypothetical protein
MKADAPEVGEVIPYWFLWSSEHEAGEESGRKLRPCIVVAALRAKTGETRVATVPVTHAEPGVERSAIEIPRAVKARLGLSERRSWIICDEFNEFVWPGFDIGRTPDGQSRYGYLPRGLIAAVREAAVRARERGALKAVPRD